MVLDLIWVFDWQVGFCQFSLVFVSAAISVCGSKAGFFEEVHRTCELVCLRCKFYLRWKWSPWQQHQQQQLRFLLSFSGSSMSWGGWLVLLRTKRRAEFSKVSSSRDFLAQNFRLAHKHRHIYSCWFWAPFMKTQRRS